MDDKKYNNFIGKFKALFAPSLPALYGQGLTDYEIIVRILNTITECVDQINSFNDIAKKLDDALSDLDGYVVDEVKRILNEMYESGDFNDILKEAAEDYLSKIPLNTELHFKRVHRELYNIGDNDRYYSIAVRPCHLQGGTYVSYNGVDYYVTALMFYGMHLPYRYNSGVILAFNTNTGLCAGGISVSMEHMNSIDYNPKDQYLYVAGCVFFTSPTDTVENPSSMLYRIHFDEIVGVNKGGLNANFINNLDTYAMADTLKLSDNAAAYQPTYESRDMKLADGNNIVNWGNNHTNHISYTKNLEAGQINVGKERALVYVYDWNENKFIAELCGESLNAQIYSMFPGGTTQSGFVFENHYYLLMYKPDCIIRCNLTTQSVEYVYNLPEILDNGYWIKGESEDIKILENGDIYLFSSLDIFQAPYTQFKMAQIFKSNIYKNMRCSRIPDKKEPLSLYVNRFITEHNPDGRQNNASYVGSSPFKTVMEAVCFANNNNVADVMNIFLETNSTFGIEISTPKKVLIRRATSNIVEVANEQKPSVGGVMCSGACNVVLQLLDIHNSYPDGYFPFDAYLYGYMSNINLSNIYFSRNATSIQTAILCRYGSLIMSGLKSDANGDFTVESGKQTANNGIPWSGDTFIDAGNSIINAHNWATKDTNIIG